MKDFKLKTGTLKIFTLILIAIVMISCNRDKGDIPYINFVLIMADDLGYGDLSCYGNTDIQTPHLDQLAKEGMLFTNYHSNGTVCSPTRAALLTGRYQQKAGIEAVVTAAKHRHTGLPLPEITMAEVFKQNGYKTGITGKWHLGYDTLYSPTNQGFDYFAGYVSGNIDYISHYDQAGYYDWWIGKDSVNEPGYSTDMITAHSIEFLKNNQYNPFLLYISHEAPHYPYQGRDDVADRFPGKKVPVHGSREDKENAYREMIEIMDEGIGNVIKTVNELGLSKNTLVFFCSDNGADKVGSNGDLRGFKGQLFEGGTRVPAIAWFPGIITPSAKNHNMVLSMDLMPTFLSVAEIPLPEDLDLDGIDVSPGILYEEPAPERPIFWRFGNKKSVIFDSWKLLIQDLDTMVFNLGEDLVEQENLFNQFPEKQEKLFEMLHDWENEMDNYDLLTQ